ncbi:MAG: hypothetical protein AUJ55_09085 [Proteobacteria bacterium CG1_02_64_396]|nr:MAG: hypothetical protein AUJ55_09085 [Proteobacteria bacterium CG1_02_64_396]
MSLFRPLWAVLLLVSIPWAAQATPSTQADGPRRAIHILEYLAADYPGAVENGQIKSPSEYAEQREFATRLDGLLAKAGLQPGEPIAQALAVLQQSIAQRADPPVISAQTQALSQAVRARFKVSAAPEQIPDLNKGQQLFVQRCAGCHGPSGMGDGPDGEGLDPKPANFTNATRMAVLSPFALYNTITLGVDGTAMRGFADSLQPDERWNLAFYVGSLPYSTQQIEEGRILLEGQRRKWADWVDSLEALTTRSESEWVREPPQRLVLAYLRQHPEQIEQGTLPLLRARLLLDRSLEALKRGDRSQALALAVSAYLDGFEHVEPPLDVINHDLRIRIETGMLGFRAALDGGATVAQLQPMAAQLKEDLEAADRALGQETISPTAGLLSALFILLREGLEAVLVVGALATLLVRSGQRRALPWLHGGWVLALLLGGLTWWLTREAVAVSGAQREVIEGVAALLAMAILFYVSYWLITKTEVARWQKYLQGKIDSALSQGSLWTMTFIAFIAVYREILETVLFFQALWVQGEEALHQSILSGIALGVAILVGLVWGMSRLGLRIPIRSFFQISSGLLYALAIILSGQGIKSLQEAGWIDLTPVAFIRVDVLGIFPSLQTLGAQGAMILAAVAAWWVLRQRGARSQKPASQR